MAIDFPNSPTNGATFSAGGKNWQYNGTGWVLQGVVPVIPDASITATQLASDAVTTAKIANSAVTIAKIEANPTFTGTVTLPSTTSIGTVSSTEIGYVDGVTSAIQTQLDSKLTATTAVTSNRNAIINGAMNVWQRGTSTFLALGGGGYVGPDRWWYYNNGFTSTISRQSCGSTLPQFQYCARIQRTSGQTGTAAMVMFSPQETWNSMRFAGKQVTVSFYARASSGLSSATALSVFVQAGTGTDQSNFGGGAYTGGYNVIGFTPTLTTSWQRFSSTGTVTSTSTEIGVLLQFAPTGTAGASDYFEITGIQLEEGSVATPFEFEDYGTTLKKCQRYYCRVYSAYLGTGMAFSTTSSIVNVFFPTTMRVAPSALETTGVAANYFQVTSNTGTQVCNAVPAHNNPSTDYCAVTAGSASTGLVQGNATFILAANGSVYFGFSAEL